MDAPEPSRIAGTSSNQALERTGVEEEATTVFGDLLNLLMVDPDHSRDEQRYLLFGMSNRRRLLVVAFAERPPRTRLISVRRATRQERRRYEED